MDNFDFYKYYETLIDNFDKNYKYYLKNKTTRIIGLTGGQGSGKSTISKILKIILKTKFNLNTVVFSIDDFYKTLKDRKKMSKKINHLFLIKMIQ